MNLTNNVQMRNNNMSNVMRAVYLKKDMSRAELAKELGVTPPTISIIVEELLKSNLIRERGIGKSIGGRKPILIQINPEFGSFVALDIRSSHIYFGIYNFLGERTHDGSRKINASSNIITELIELVRSIIDQHAGLRFLGIGISVSGVVSERKVIKYSSVFNLKDVPLKRIMEKEFQIPVMIEERVRSASFAQIWFNPLMNATENFVNIHIGKGIGASVVLHGKICYGSNESAGELGHMILLPDGPLCDCGSRGCLETLSSEKAIVRYVTAAIEQGKPTSLSAFAERHELDGQRVITAAEDGDEVALQAIQLSCKYLAIGIINLIRLLDPSAVYIMNSISESDELISKYLFQYMNEYSLGSYEWKTEINFVADKNICLNGAVAMILDELFASVRENFFELS